MSEQSKKTRTLISVAVFSALAFICTVFFHFKASFLTFDLKDAVMAVGGMIFGPVYGGAMVIIVSLAEMLSISTTGLYGFIMNILSSLTFVIVSSVIYRNRHTLSAAVIAMISATLATTAVMLLANLIITPYYMGVTVSDVITLIPTLLLPFNLIKSVFNSALLFAIYKPISNALKAAKIIESDDSSAVYPKSSTKSVIITAIAVFVAVLTLVIFFVYLNGSFSLS